MSDFLTPRTMAGRRLLDVIAPAPTPLPDGRMSVVDASRLDVREELGAMIVRVENEAHERAGAGRPLSDLMGPIPWRRLGQ